MRIKRVLLIALFLFTLQFVFADTVILNSGREIIGSIVSTEGDTVIIRDVDNIEYRINKANIKAIQLNVNAGQQKPPISTGQPTIPKPSVSFDQEDNNSFSRANFLKIPASGLLEFQGRIFPKRDRDYYYFKVETPGEYSIRITGKESVSRLGVRIINADNGTVKNWKWSPEGDRQVVTDIDQGYLNTGDLLYFEVAQYSDNVEINYDIKLSVKRISDPFEPNNSFKAAKQIPLDDALRAFIFPRADRDYYKLEIPGAGRLTVLSTHEDVNMRPGIRLISNENVTLRNWMYAPDVAKSVEFFHDFAAADEVYLELLNYGDSRRSLLTYGLKNELIRINDQYEPNNRFNTAKRINIGTTHSAYIFPRRDRDYYDFVLEKPGVLTIKISTDDPLTRPSFRIISEENNTIRNWMAAPENKNEVETSNELLSGRYYLEVMHYGDNYASLVDYKLDLALTPANDSYEKNDSFADAKAIKLNAPLNATIFPRGDKDFYKFRMMNPGELSVVLKSGNLLRMAARLINADNGTILNWQTASDFGKELNFAYSVKNPGLYYLDVRCYADSRGSTNPYSLLITAP